MSSSNRNILKEKQGFTAVDMLMSLTMLLALGFLVVPVLWKKTSENSHRVTMMEAQKLSNSIIRRFQNFNETQARSLASMKSPKINYEGIIGRDAWGNPYHYRVLKNIYGQPSHLVVWSRGSNSRQDTKESHFYSAQGRVEFSGDDIGYILPLGSS